jgi:hypothetical protein
MREDPVSDYGMDAWAHVSSDFGDRLQRAGAQVKNKPHRTQVRAWVYRLGRHLDAFAYTHAGRLPWAGRIDDVPYRVRDVLKRLAKDPEMRAAFVFVDTATFDTPTWHAAVNEFLVGHFPNPGKGPAYALST